MDTPLRGKEATTWWWWYSLFVGRPHRENEGKNKLEQHLEKDKTNKARMTIHRHHLFLLTTRRGPAGAADPPSREDCPRSFETAPCFPLRHTKGERDSVRFCAFPGVELWWNPAGL